VSQTTDSRPTPLTPVRFLKLIGPIFFQVYLTSISKRLYDVTEAQIDDVTILLPATWTGNEACISGRNLSISGADLSLARSVDPDFSILDPHPIFGPEPWVQQFGGCGVRGKGVSIPFPYLTENGNKTDPKTGEVLVFMNLIII